MTLRPLSAVRDIRERCVTNPVRQADTDSSKVSDFEILNSNVCLFVCLVALKPVSVKTEEVTATPSPESVRAARQAGR